ncbi:MAG: DnaJ domain-containing protein [Campylobacterota bacterium]|nr:DnaJ domain-containing protein [Campylobacterota bacterium]
MISYKDFEKSLESLGIVSKFTLSDLKSNYLQLSKKHHPDMADGDALKFKEINEAYKLIQKYTQNYRFGVDEKDFYQQNPFAKKPKDWFYDF